MEGVCPLGVLPGAGGACGWMGEFLSGGGLRASRPQLGDSKVGPREPGTGSRTHPGA